MKKVFDSREGPALCNHEARLVRTLVAARRSALYCASVLYRGVAQRGTCMNLISVHTINIIIVTFYHNCYSSSLTDAGRCRPISILLFLFLSRFYLLFLSLSLLTLLISKSWHLPLLL